MDIDTINFLEMCLRSKVTNFTIKKSGIKEMLKAFRKLQKEIALLKTRRSVLLYQISEDAKNINKLINYIAVRENKDYEEVRKEFDIWVR